MSRPPSHLLRVLGVTFGIAVTIGNTIGAGILRTPGDIASALPTPALFLLVWIIGAIYALLGANALAELGTLIPRSGGQYVFSQRALGSYAGFVVGWSDWLSTCGSAAAVAIVVGEYASPFLKGTPAGTIAVIAIFLFTLLQWIGTRTGGRTQEITTLLKTLAFVVLIVACFLAPASAESNGGAASAATLAGFVLAIQAVIYTYDGWSGVIYFSEEVKDPDRDIPRSMFSGVILVAAIYLLVNLAFLHVVPLSRLAGEKLAAGVVAAEVFGRYGDAVVRTIMIISLLAALNAFLLMATRVAFGLSRDRLFTNLLDRVNAGGTPHLSLALSTAIALGFLLTGTFEKVIALLAFFFVANYTLSFVSLFVLRRREPTAPRPYRAWGHPFTTALVLAASVAFLVAAIAADTRNSVYALVVLALSYPAYRLTLWRKNDRIA